MIDAVETSELLVFTRTVEAKSLSRAAAELSTPRATIGRCLARLEERLGVRLLRRTTRALAPQVRAFIELLVAWAPTAIDAQAKTRPPAKRPAQRSRIERR
jgi:DNA-binding transcriptional LysR family regulator